MAYTEVKRKAFPPPLFIVPYQGFGSTPNRYASGVVGAIVCHHQ